LQFVISVANTKSKKQCTVCGLQDGFYSRFSGMKYSISSMCN
jgi:hypothetical protein